MSNDVTLKSILLLAANPKGTKSLRLQEEEREIKERLRLAGYGSVPINSTGATRPRDIQQALLDFKPQIVHFGGHGAGHDGLVFEDVTGQEKLVSSEALANLFRLFSNRVECVILNACYSRFQAEAIAKHIRYVIGMSRAIGDSAAIEFAVGFYTAIGAGESIDFAYELGCNAIQLEGIPEHLTPVFYRDGELIRAYPDKREQPTNELNRNTYGIQQVSPIEVSDQRAIIQKPDSSSKFVMTIEDVFSIVGRGTVVTGCIEQGEIHVGDSVKINAKQGQELSTVVTGVEKFQKQSQSGVTGERVGLLLRGIKKNDVARGMVIYKP